MVRALVSVAVRNLRSRPVASLATFALVATAAATLALGLQVRSAASAPWDRVVRQANGADVYATSLRATDLRPVERLPGVAASTRYPAVYGHSIASGADVGEVVLEGRRRQPDRVARPVVTAGTWLSSDDGIVVERSFAEQLGIRVGQRVQVLSGHGRLSLRVDGLAIFPGKAPYPNWKPAAAAVTPATLNRIEPDRRAWSERLAVQLADPRLQEQFIGRALQVTSGRVDLFGADHIRADVADDNKTNATILNVFSVLAVIAVGFILANAIGGRVIAQLREVGLLKAVGFRPREVTALLLIELLALGLVASVVGALIGAAVSPLMLGPTAELLHTTVRPSFGWMPLLSTVVAVEAAIAVFTILPAWRAGRVPTVRAIGAGFSPARPGRSRLAALAVRLRLPLSVAVGVKDVFARRGRAILTVASLALTVAMAMQVLQMEAMLRTTAARDLFREEPYDVQVRAPYLRPEAVERLLAHRSQIRAAATLTWRDMELAGAPPGSAVFVRALGGDYRALDYRLEAGRFFSAPGEAVLADAAFDRYGLRLGDRVTLRDGSRTMTVRIVGRYADNDNGGLMLMTSLATLRRSEPAAQPDTYGVQLRDDRDAAVLKAELVRDSRQQLEVTVTPSADPEANRIRRIVYVLCAVLLLVGVVNLLTTTLLGVRERVRDFGILKTIGLTPRQLVVAVTAGGALLALLAAAVGMPLGVGLYRGLVSALADPAERSALLAVPAWWWMALLVPATLVFAAVGTALPARRAASVDVATALRYE